MRLAERNLRAGRGSLQARVRRVEARLAVPAGGRHGRPRGYATPAGQYSKVIRLRALRATPLARLANRPQGRYRLSCRVEFTYRGDEAGTQGCHRCDQV